MHFNQTHSTEKHLSILQKRLYTEHLWSHVHFEEEFTVSRPKKAVVEYRIYDLPSRFPMLLLDGEDWHISDVRTSRLHFHNCFEIGICHSGSGTLVFDGIDIPFQDGTVSSIPRHIAHTTFSSQGTRSLWSYIFLNFEKVLGQGDSNYLTDMGKPLEINFYKLFSKGDHPRIHFLVMSMIEELRSKQQGYEKIVQGLTSVLYYELLRVSDTAIAQETSHHLTYSIAPALDYIYDNYMNRFPMNALSDVCHLSATHFRRLFLSVMGATPLTFLNEVRIEKACELLVSTSDSVLAVSGAVGFTTFSSFSRCFQQIMGLPPREYRVTWDSGEIKSKSRVVLPYTGWFKAEDLSEAGENLPG
jgi:AraC-like DNA-binding protein